MTYQINDLYRCCVVCGHRISIVHNRIDKICCSDACKKKWHRKVLASNKIKRSEYITAEGGT